MARVTLLITLLSAVIVTVTADNENLTCYTCMGFDPKYPERSGNTKACSNKDWDASSSSVGQTSNYNDHNFMRPFCTVETIPAMTEGKTVQQRALMGYVTRKGVETLMRFNGTTMEPASLGKDSGAMEGYYCMTDLCNSAISSVTGGSLLTAVFLGLLTKLF